jgi:hypothetical protein
MKHIIILLFVFLSTELLAQDKEWILDRSNFYVENDVFSGTDNQYTAGERFTFLYYIPDEDYAIYDLLGNKNEESYSYFTFSITSQIFTPSDKSQTSLITDDRPYAGWLYTESTIHKASKDELRSLSLKIGIIGPHSYAEDIQNNFHLLIGSPHVYGWDNQLKDELGISLKYTQKYKLSTIKTDYFETSFIPFVSAELGNVAINATVGFNARIGWNIPKDFGVSSIDIGADPGIPIYKEYKDMRLNPWSFSLNLTAAESAVARDIFLDGNTFRDSHSVEKKNFVNYYGIGFTLRYKDFVFDFMEIHNSKKFKFQEEPHAVGTLIVSWLF